MTYEVRGKKEKLSWQYLGMDKQFRVNKMNASIEKPDVSVKANFLMSI